MSFLDFKDQTTRAVVSKTIDGILSYTNKNREAGLLKLTDISEKLMGDKFNKSLFTFVCLMYQQYNDTFHELRMQLENQVVQIP